MKPYQQGSLDSTCGFYAIINAIRLAARGLTERECEYLYYEMVRHLGRKFSAESILMDGLTTQEISILLHTAKKYLAKRKKLNLYWYKPYHSSKLPRLESALHLIRAHLKIRGSVFIGYEGMESHWTVIRHVSDRTIYLFDSGGTKQILLAQASLSLKSKRPFILALRSLFLIHCSKGRHHENSTK